MADLKPLIRVRKHDIEQKQKTLAELYRQAEELKKQRDSIEIQLAIEQEKTKDMDAEMLNFFGPYAALAKTQIEAVDDNRDKLEQLIVMAQEDMRKAFAELKKVEIIAERRDAEGQAELDKKDADELDEIAIDGFRRGDD